VASPEYETPRAVRNVTFAAPASPGGPSAPVVAAPAGPLVHRKASSRAAGLIVLVIALAAIGAVVPLPFTGLLRGSFLVMVILDPLLVAQYGYRQYHRGPERTTGR
jgi:hypothetical protein